MIVLCADCVDAGGVNIFKLTDTSEGQDTLRMKG